MEGTRDYISTKKLIFFDLISILIVGEESMKKNISLSVFLLFLFPNPVYANIGFHNFTNSYTHYIPFIPIASLIEALIFWILTEALFHEKGNVNFKKDQIRFQRILIVLLIANITSFLIGIFLKHSGVSFFSKRYFLYFLFFPFLLTVLIEWLIYIPFFQKSTYKRSKLLIFSFLVNLFIYTLMIIMLIYTTNLMGSKISQLLLWHPRSNLKYIIPHFNVYPLHYFKVKSNLNAIRTVEEAYYAEEGIYLPCKPAPPPTEEQMDGQIHGKGQKKTKGTLLTGLTRYSLSSQSTTSPTIHNNTTIY